MGNSSARRASSALSSGDPSPGSNDTWRESAGGAAPAQPGYWQQAKRGYKELVNAIIRPPRCNYSVAHLGPKTFSLAGKQMIRRDFELINERGLTLVCSHWGPEERQPILPCVVYMHGNSSARVEAISQLTTVLSLGATLFSFDFSGSGNSGGDYVSLGAYEKV